MEGATKADDLPDEVELFPYQVAGHKHGKGRLGLGILKHKNGQILKPLFEDNGRAEKELSFYKDVFQNYGYNPHLGELKEFLPDFYGTKVIYISGKGVNFLCLEDVCRTFENPSLLDVKIGPITHEEGASEMKIQEQKSKFLHGEACGIRIVGMKVFDENKQIHISPEKSFLRQLSPDTIASGLDFYFTKDKLIDSLLLCGFIHKLSRLDCWFKNQRKLKFIGSSILFIYEGTRSSWRAWLKSKNLNISLHNLQNSNDQNTSSIPTNFSHDSSLLKSENTDKCFICGLDKYMCTEVLANCNLFRLVMIDFAHVSYCEKGDINYLIGLHKLIYHLKKLLKLRIKHS